MSRCRKEAPRLMKRLLESPGRNGVAARAVIEAEDRVVMAPMLLQLLASPAGPLEEVFHKMMLIEAGGRAVMAPALLQLLASPVGPLGVTSGEIMERAFLGPLHRARWRLRGSASWPAPAVVGAQGTGLIRRPHNS